MEEYTEQYTALAGHYDRLTFDVDYKGWAAFAQKMFRKHHIPGKLILELACGTGSLSYELAQRGFDMISSDISPDMLSVAREKCAGLEHMPMFICQDMTRIDLYGGVSGCVCGLDSVNYVTDIRGLRRMFRRVSTFLEPGGFSSSTSRAPVFLKRWRELARPGKRTASLPSGNTAMTAGRCAPATPSIFSKRPAAFIAVIPRSIISGRIPLIR